MTDIQNYTLLGNSITALTYFAGSTIVLFYVILLMRGIFVKNLAKVAHKTKSIIDDVILDVMANVRKVTIFILAFIISLNFLKLPNNIQQYSNLIVIVILTFEFAKTLNLVLRKFVASKFDENKSAKTLYVAFEKVIEVIIYAIGGILILDNFGVNVSALIAGLGVGGIAVALAVQNLLADILASVAIYLDKPFEIGDVIKINGELGTVERIGLKTTILRSSMGSEILISNKEISNKFLENIGRIKSRKVRFHLGVAYDTKPSKLRKIPDIVNLAADFSDKVEITLCTLTTMNESSLDFLVIAHYKTNDYMEFNQLQHEFNINILEKLEKEKIEIPFPTRTIYNKK